ncbi:DoxX family protein [Roseomonas sp. JC162]|uniref:DoxX family protein n=1 Tax=Neoroseomonas marina TaxID=1232220 RepID=A0A848ECC6_9PROT|nr:DoxX family protein [Neoroseomonas marina]NMJ40968.1 DoxX family protein [Neoroseomonas marina]
MSRLAAFVRTFQPLMLSLLRIMVGLVLLQYGLSKLFGFPAAAPGGSAFPGQVVFSGVLETVAGVMLVLGFFTRPAAFIMAGYMAVAYFWIHQPRDFFPARNGGNLSILFCFCFLYLTTAGSGPLGLDRILGRGGKA